MVLYGAVAQDGKTGLGTSSDKAQRLFNSGFSGHSAVDTARVYDLAEVDSVPAPPQGGFAMNRCAVAEPDTNCVLNSKVVVACIIERNGACSSVTVVRPACPQLDAAAICMIEKGGHWQPGFHRGRPVRTRMLVPVVIDLR